MIRVTAAGALQDAPALIDETIIRYVGPAGDANATTQILQQDTDVPIIVRETVDQLEQLIQEAKKNG
jgi:hypothetical protein